MKLGFTGTRQGLTGSQRRQLQMYVAELRPDRAHHGCAIGADREFHHTVRCWDEYCLARIIGHPCDIKGQSSTSDCDELRDEKPPLERNHDIVDECDHLIACPATEAEEWRSGTWATVRYAKKQHKPLTIVYPSGRTEHFN